MILALAKHSPANCQHSSTQKANVNDGCRITIIQIAKCYLVMYDGGWDYDREHILENMHAARFILEDSKEGNQKITEMFEEWLKTREACKKKNESIS